MKSPPVWNCLAACIEEGLDGGGFPDPQMGIGPLRMGLVAPFER